jgi:hypothetical protein
MLSHLPIVVEAGPPPTMSHGIAATARLNQAAGETSVRRYRQPKEGGAPRTLLAAPCSPGLMTNIRRAFSNVCKVGR